MILIGSKKLPCGDHSIKEPFDEGRTIKCTTCKMVFKLTLERCSPHIEEMLRDDAYKIRFVYEIEPPVLDDPDPEIHRPTKRRVTRKKLGTTASKAAKRKAFN